MSRQEEHRQEMSRQEKYRQIMSLQENADRYCAGDWEMENGLPSNQMAARCFCVQNLKLYPTPVRIYLRLIAFFAFAAMFSGVRPKCSSSSFGWPE